MGSGGSDAADEVDVGTVEEQAEEDRRLHELVQELRLVLPGTTVLFGSLLSVPFSSRFDELGPTGRMVHFAAFVSAAVALLFLPAEAGQAVTGLALLGCALLARVALVADFVHGARVALAVSIPVAIGAAGAWFALPLPRRLRGDPPRRRGPSARDGAAGEPS